MNLILLSGWGGVGKPEYCQWLAKERGFVHVEVNSAPRRELVLRAHNIPSASAARNVVRAIGPSVVVEWGFDVPLFQCVQLLRAVGFEAWWFDGDRYAAQQGYVKRRGTLTEAVGAYDRQTRAIEAAWSRLRAFYADRVIRTLPRDGTHVPFEGIARGMFVTA